MCVCHKKDYFLAYLRHIYLVYYVTKVFFSTRKPAFSILLICTKKIDTTNRISIAIINETIW